MKEKEWQKGGGPSPLLGEQKPLGDIWGKRRSVTGTLGSGQLTGCAQIQIELTDFQELIFRGLPENLRHPVLPAGWAPDP